jgi:hypothetical protein
MEYMSYVGLFTCFLIFSWISLPVVADLSGGVDSITPPSASTAFDLFAYTFGEEAIMNHFPHRRAFIKQLVHHSSGRSEQSNTTAITHETSIMVCSRFENGTVAYASLLVR